MVSHLSPKKNQTPVGPEAGKSFTTCQQDTIRVYIHQDPRGVYGFSHVLVLEVSGDTLDTYDFSW